MSSQENFQILDVQQVKPGNLILGFMDVPQSFLNLTEKGINFLRKYGFYQIVVLRNNEKMTLDPDQLKVGDQLLTMGSLRNFIQIYTPEQHKTLMAQGFKRVRTVSAQESESSRQNLTSPNTKPAPARKNTKDLVRTEIHKLQDSVKVSQETAKRGTELVSDLFTKGNPQHSDLAAIQEVSNEINGLIAENKSAMNTLSFLEEHDDYTFRHCIDVANQTLTALTYLNKIKPTFSQEQLRDIGVGTLLHDIGKSKIPQELINKPGKLTDREWEYMRMHPTYSAKIMSNLGLSKTNIEIGFYHHVLKDGSGYPQIDYEKVLPVVRMCTLSDVFQALTTKRPYKKTDTPSVALKKIKIWSTDQFDEYLTNIFIKGFGVYPPGSLVELNDGRIGFVFLNAEDSSRPIIALVIDKQGIRIQNKEIIELQNPDFSSLNIVRSLTISDYFKNNEAIDLFLSIEM